MVYDPNIAILILIGGLLLLIFLRVPIVFSVGISTTLCLIYMGFGPAALIQHTIRGMSSFAMMAIPFFITMGALLSAGGVGKRLINLAGAMVGWMRGSLMQINIASSVVFSGISGSAAADVASVGSVVMPQMIAAGYKKDITGAISMSSAIMAVTKPPSHNMVIYATAAGGVSIGSLFLAGYIPTFLMCFALMIAAHIISIRGKYPKGDKFSLKRLIVEFGRSLFALTVIVIVVVGVIAGIFTATESAAIAVIYSLLISIHVYKGLKWREVWGVLGKAVNMLSMIMILIGVSAAFGFALTFLQVPQLLALWVSGMTDNPILILLMINLFLLFLGSIMDMAPLILITTPILLPMAVGAGMSPITFGVVMILNCGIGLITPPVGTVLFISSSVAKESSERLIKANLPFYACLIAVLLLITFVPALTTWLPSVFGT